MALEPSVGYALWQHFLGPNPNIRGVRIPAATFTRRKTFSELHPLRTQLSGYR
jgi:hypothetical protein